MLKIIFKILCVYLILKKIINKKYFIAQKKFGLKILLKNYKKIKKYLIIC